MNYLELAENVGKSSEKFLDVIMNFLQDPLDAVIIEGHKDFINNAINDKNVNPEMFDFLCGYKKLVKQHKRQKDIAFKALQFLEDSAEPKKLEVDWLEFFFDKARLISNPDMQLIWAKLLAEEANHPGKISFSLLHTLSVMRFEDAEFFCNISRFALRSFGKEEVTLLLFVSTNRKAYEHSRITPRKLKELERLGLIECDFNTEYVFKNEDNPITKKVFISGGQKMTVYGDPANDNKIKAGNVEFTANGRALYDIIDPDYKRYRDGIFMFIIRKFKSRKCRVFVNNLEM